MRILLIGERTLFMDSVHKILTQENDVEVSRSTFHELAANNKEQRSEKFNVAILGLFSISEKCTNWVTSIAQQNICDYLVALHNKVSEKFCESVYQAGADYCFSLDSKTEELRSLVRHCIQAD